MSRRRTGQHGIVYSTDPDFDYKVPDDPAENRFRPDAEQEITIRLDRKHRAGKLVTLITGFDYTDDRINEIGKEIKRFCGTGGSAKDGEIIIQGDFRDKTLQWLKQRGYSRARKI